VSAFLTLGGVGLPRTTGVLAGRLPTPEPADPLVVVRFQLAESELEAVDQHALAVGHSRSDVLRAAVQAFLATQESRP